MKKSTTIITALLVAATCHLLFCFAYDFFEEYGRTLPSRREQQRLGCLNQAVRGYISDEDFDNAFFEAVLVEYHGGWANAFQSQNGMALCQSDYIDRLDISKEGIRYDLGDTEKGLLLDICNIIVRDNLSNQKDAFPNVRVVDGGESRFRFVVGKYKGQFKLVNTAPKHLEIFLYKVNKLMESSKDCNSQIHSHLTC